MQSANAVFMVRPSSFTVNEETSITNFFQKKNDIPVNAQSVALAAFSRYVTVLRKAGIEVVVFDDPSGNETPDSIFPNNWITMDSQGNVILYPMEAVNRRKERNSLITDYLAEHYHVKKLIDLSPFENEKKFLEGTGSLVCDHDNKIAYICRSTRSSPEVMAELSCITGYKAFWFNAFDHNHHSIYHTNVMMSIGKKHAVVCFESITDYDEAKILREMLQQSGKIVIDITLKQMECFCGNILELINSDNYPVFAMSTRAWQAFTLQQRITLSDYAKIVLAPIDIIENLGGGGARCMIAEIFLTKKKDRNNAKEICVVDGCRTV